MGTLQAEITDTAIPLTLNVQGASGGVTGLTAVVAIRDGSTTNSWLDFNDNTFKTAAWTTRQASMTEVSSSNAPGVYHFTLDVSAVSGVAAGDFWVIEYDATGSADANAHDVLILRTTLYTPAVAGDAMDLVTDAVDAAAVATGAIDADAIAANAITSAKIATDAIGAAQIAADAIGSSELGTTAVNEIRDAILSDSTPFAGANIDAAISTRATQASVDTVDGIVDAILVDTAAIDALTASTLDAAISTRAVAGDAMALTAAAVDSVWDEAQSGHTTAGTFGKYLDVEVSSVSGGGGLTAQDVRDAMKLAPTAGAPAAGSVDEHLDDILTDTAAIDSAVSTNLDAQVSTLATQTSVDTVDANVDAILVDTAAIEPLVTSNLDAAVSTRTDQYFGKIWIDTTNGTSGAVAGTNGTMNNPVDNWADAASLSTSTGHRTYHLAPDSAIAVTTSQVAKRFEGNGTAIVNLNTIDFADSTFYGLRLINVFGGTGDVYVENCTLLNVSGASGTFKNCSISGTFAARSGANVDLVNCRNWDNSVNANGGRLRWSGHLGYATITGMTDSLQTHQIYSEGGAIEFDASNTDGTLNFLGNADVIRNDALTDGKIYGLAPIDVKGATFDTATDSLEAIRNALGTAGDDLAIIDTTAITTQTGSGLVVPTWSGVTTDQYAGLQVRLTASGGEQEVRSISTHTTTAVTLDSAPVVSMTGGTLDVLARQASSVASVDTGAIADAVWDEALSGHLTAGTTGAALNTATGAVPDITTLQNLLNQYIGIVQRYAPVVVTQPIVTKDAIFKDDEGVVLTIPVERDGVLADMTDVTSAVFYFQAPGSDTTVTLTGAVGTGSEVTVTTDDTVFTTTGRWKVQALVTWGGATPAVQWTHWYEVLVNPPLPHI